MSIKKSPIIFNSTESCYIIPRLPNYPNGLYLDYNTCPERYDNTTLKLVRLCCFSIILNLLENSNYKRVQDWLTYNSSSMLVLPAVFFNMLSFLVLTRFSKLNASATSTNFYMECLCVFDSLTMLSKFLHEIIVVRNTIRDVPFVFNAAVCKLTYFAESVFAITSIYILIAMSFDKLICVVIPLKVSSLLTPRKARFICATIFVLASIYSSSHLINQQIHVLNSVDSGLLQASSTPSIPSSNFTYRSNSSATLSNNNSLNTLNFSFSNSSNTKTGTARTIYECKETLADTMRVVDNIVRVFIPIMLLILCNSSIAIALARARKFAKVMLASEASFDTTSPSTSDFSKFKNKNHFISSKKSFRISNPNLIPNDEKTEEIIMQQLIKPSNSQLSINNINNTASISYTKSKEALNKINKSTCFENCCCFKVILAKKRNMQKSASQNQISQSQMPHNVHNRRARNNTHYISFMLFAICFGFVVLNLPFAIKTIFERQFREKNETLNYLYSSENYYHLQVTKTDIIKAVKSDFFVYITHFLLDLNYIANFFLYFLSGSRFRSQLYSLLRCENACNTKNGINYREYTIDNSNNGNSKLYVNRRVTRFESTRNKKPIIKVTAN